MLHKIAGAAEGSKQPAEKEGMRHLSAVSVGEGINAIFKGLGVDYI